MTQNHKYLFRWAFIACVLYWVLTSSARSGNWGMFWFNLGSLLFALLTGFLMHLFGNKTKKLIHKNMLDSEKEQLTAIAGQLGIKLGIRIAPLAFLIAFSGMLFDRSWLVYTLPTTAILLIALCIPPWKKNKVQSDALYLKSKYAKDNGITMI